MILDSMTDRQKKQVIAVKPQSLHPDDEHIAIVLRKISSVQPDYVVYIYNSENNSFSNGDYSNNLTDAMTAFNGRGVTV